MFNPPLPPPPPQKKKSFGFYMSAVTSLLKTLWEKEKLLVTSNFYFSHSVYNLCGEPSAIFVQFKIVVCKFFQFGRVYNLSFWKRLKDDGLRKFAGKWTRVLKEPWVYFWPLTNLHLFIYYQYRKKVATPKNVTESLK